MRSRTLDGVGSGSTAITFTFSDREFEIRVSDEPEDYGPTIRWQRVG